MNYSRALAALVCASGIFSVTPAHAINDWKGVDATDCQAYGPGTLATELTYNQLGVTNPGTTNESVMCPMPTDGDNALSATAGTSAAVYAYFRAGAIAGRVACTVFVSKTTMVSGPTYSFTANPANVPAGSRSYLYMGLADVTGGSWTIAPTTVLLCTLTPKVTLGGFILLENVITNSP